MSDEEACSEGITSGSGQASEYCCSVIQDEQRDLAKTIRVSGSILLSTVSNFLDFFKMEAGKSLDVVRTEVDLEVISASTSNALEIKLICAFPARRLGATSGVHVHHWQMAPTLPVGYLLFRSRVHWTCCLGLKVHCSRSAGLHSWGSDLGRTASLHHSGVVAG